MKKSKLIGRDGDDFHRNLFRLSKAEQEQLDLALQLSKDTVETNEVSVELPVILEEKKPDHSQSSVLSHGNRVSLLREF